MQSNSMLKTQVSLDRKQTAAGGSLGVGVGIKKYKRKLAWSKVK